MVLITVLGDDAAPLPLWASQYRMVQFSERGWASGAEYDNPEESSRTLAFQGFWQGAGVFGQDAGFLGKMRSFWAGCGFQAKPPPSPPASWNHGVRGEIRPGL